MAGQQRLLANLRYKMKFHKLQIKDFLILASIVALVYLYIMVDQLFVPIVLRPYAILIIIQTLLVAFFFIVKPYNIIHLSNSLLLCLGGMATVLILIQHVIIKFDFNFKVLIILMIISASPYLSGFLYFMLSKNRNRQLGSK